MNDSPIITKQSGFSDYFIIHLKLFSRVNRALFQYTVFMKCRFLPTRIVETIEFSTKNAQANSVAL